MTRRYEALLALDTRGHEDSAKDIIERIEKLFTTEGATIEQVQRLDRREFAYERRHMKSAYFVNVIFAAAPAQIEKFRARLKLDADVTLQNFLVLPDKKAAA